MDKFEKAWSEGYHSNNPDVRSLTAVLQVVAFIAMIATFISIWLHG